MWLMEVTEDDPHVAYDDDSCCSQNVESIIRVRILPCVASRGG